MGRREELLAAVRARVERAEAGDASAVLEAAAHAEAHDLAGLVGESQAGPDALHVLGRLHHQRSLALPEAASGQDRDEAVRFFALCYARGTGAPPPPLFDAVSERAAASAGDLLHRALLSTDPMLLKSAVAQWEHITDGLPPEHPKRASYLTFLGLALQEREERTGELGRLDEVEEASHTATWALPHDYPQRAWHLHALAVALTRRHERTGEFKDIDRAVRAGRTAVDSAAPDDDDRATYLCDLRLALLERYHHSESPLDLDEAIEVARAAVSATAPDDPRHALYLLHLSSALSGQQFPRTWDLADLDEAIEVGRAAVESATGDDPGRAFYLASLSSDLGKRFERTGGLADLTEAVDTGRAAVESARADDPHRTLYLAGLSSVLEQRFDRSGKLADLDEAEEAGRAAIADTPYDDPGLTTYLDALGIIMRRRFLHTGHLEDLAKAEEANRAAVRATPEDDPAHAVCLTNLGRTLLSRYQHTQELGDLDKAVETSRAATRAATAGDPRHSVYLSNLGAALWTRLFRTQQRDDLDEALTVLRQASEDPMAPAWLRVRAARVASYLAAPLDFGHAADLIDRAVRLLPEIAPRRLLRTDQEHALGNTSGIAAEAISLALADTSGTAGERAARALRLAEVGRAVLLSQALDTRTDLAELHDRHPELARRFTSLRERLDQDPTAVTATAGYDPGAAWRERHLLAAELEDVRAAIRSREGFADFGRAPTTDELIAEAAHGPVVTFNVNGLRSDALLLTRHGITSCPLPDLTFDAVTERISAFYEALAAATAPDRDRIAAQGQLSRILEWLWDAAAEPVLSALAEQGVAPAPETPTGRSGRLPRVWWAPGGLLGQLPLHAAGYHTEPAGGGLRRTALDRVVSSYTPTVRALRHARARRPRPLAHSRSLIVAMPATPGHAPLHHVSEEVRRIRALLHGPVQLTGPARAHAAGDARTPPAIGTPTTARVLAQLPQSGIAHFACHGTSDSADPSRSGLLLHDHATAPLTVSALAQVDLDRAHLAYLSACSTANPGDGRLRDEAIHLTSAFQLAGFPHVVGTLWPIDDRLAAEIAESFYTHLAPGPPGTLAPDRSAAALHATIRQVRDRYPATPSLWAAYLHAGA
ncbi:CHAT domain-containing protein [Streptomyces monticola]|uniref:CHAT domain-containing protein n=1 Tax=Streptomyces monticola TaxID=2666263 RepID=A0ABW2JET8_9ACTN